MHATRKGTSYSIGPSAAYHSLRNYGIVDRNASFETTLCQRIGGSPLIVASAATDMSEGSLDKPVMRRLKLAATT